MQSKTTGLLDDFSDILVVLKGLRDISQTVEGVQWCDKRIAEVESIVREIHAPILAANAA